MLKLVDHTWKENVHRINQIIVLFDIVMKIYITWVLIYKKWFWSISYSI